MNLMVSSTSPNFDLQHGSSKRHTRPSYTLLTYNVQTIKITKSGDLDTATKNFSGGSCSNGEVAEESVDITSLESNSALDLSSKL